MTNILLGCIIVMNLVIIVGLLIKLFSLNATINIIHKYEDPTTASNPTVTQVEETENKQDPETHQQFNSILSEIHKIMGVDNDNEER